MPVVDLLSLLLLLLYQSFVLHVDALRKLSFLELRQSSTGQIFTEILLDCCRLAESAGR